MKRIFTFLREVQGELSKVVWPTRRKALRLSIVVIIVTIVFGAFIAGVDYGLTRGVEYAIDASQKKKTSAPASAPPDATVTVAPQPEVPTANGPVAPPAPGTNP